MAPLHAATPASATDAESGRHEDLRCGSHSSFSAASEHDQRFSWLGLIVEVGEMFAQAAVVTVAAALCGDVATLECGLHPARAMLIESIRPFRESAPIGEEDAQ